MSPTLKFSMKTALSAAMRRTSAWPCGWAMSIVIERLFLLADRYIGDSRVSRPLSVDRNTTAPSTKPAITASARTGVAHWPANHHHATNPATTSAPASTNLAISLEEEAVPLERSTLLFIRLFLFATAAINPSTAYSKWRAR